MYNENDKINMRNFIIRLISNPALKNEPKLIVEENIINFFTQNGDALKNTLSSSSFFPHLNWMDIQGLFYETLVEEINKDLLPMIENNIFKKINFQFLNLMMNRQIPTKNFLQDFKNLILRSIKRFEIRRNLIQIHNVIENHIIEKYISEIYSKKAYIAREINFERLKLQPDMISQLIKVILILGVFGYVRPELTSTSIQQKVQSTKSKLSNYMQKNYYEKIMRQFFIEAKYLTDDLVTKAVSIHLNFLDDKSIPATSRLARIFSILGKNYKPKIKIDKGADTFEKSWFQSQRRNYKYYGFDIDMLDELYRISAENYW